MKIKLSKIAKRLMKEGEEENYATREMSMIEKTQQKDRVITDLVMDTLINQIW